MALLENVGVSGCNEDYVSVALYLGPTKRFEQDWDRCSLVGIYHGGLLNYVFDFLMN